jgi:hypothetical protein
LGTYNHHLLFAASIAVSIAGCIAASIAVWQKEFLLKYDRSERRGRFRIKMEAGSEKRGAGIKAKARGKIRYSPCSPLRLWEGWGADYMRRPVPLRDVSQSNWSRKSLRKAGKSPWIPAQKPCRNDDPHHFNPLTGNFPLANQLRHSLRVSPIQHLGLGTATLWMELKDANGSE